MTSTALVLVVEDDAPMRRTIRAALEAQAMRVVEATTAADATKLAAMHTPELVLLDLGLPDEDGVALVRALREWMTAPIVVVSARARVDEKIEALDAGADDYVTKPFVTAELLARVRAALRRARARPTSALDPTIAVGDLRVDRSRHVVHVARREVHLTPNEYRLLVLFAESPGRVLTHRQILDRVWGASQATHTHYVRVYVAELRKKIERDPAHPTRLLTEAGVGYRLIDPADP